MTQAIVTEYEQTLTYANFPLFLWQKDLSFLMANYLYAVIGYYWGLIGNNCKIHPGALEKGENQDPHISP